MKSSLLLSAAIALLLPALPVHSASAQYMGVDDPSPKARAARKAALAKRGAASTQAPLYPNATRVSPSQTGSKSLASAMQSLLELQQKDGVEDQVIAKADAILANPAANPFDKSSAAYIAGAAWQGKESDGYANAVKYYKLAVDNNGLHNNNHYRAMMQLAQMLEADNRHEEALTMIDRFLTETKSDDMNAWTVKTQILVSLDRPKDAAVALEKLLAAKPNDKKLMMNLTAVYMQSDQDAKAGQMFDKMRAAGLMTESKDYEAAFRLLGNIEGREKDAMAIIDEGLKKGILQPSYDMYAFQGRTYYAAEDLPKALEAWSKGAPMSKNGELYLNVAKLQLDGQHFADAKAAALQAQAKGVRRPGDVYQVLVRAEQGLGNKAAARAAMQEAAKYPETKKWAETVLRQTSVK